MKNRSASRILEQEYYKNRKVGTKSNSVINSTVREVLKIATKYLNKPAKELIVLDVGSGSGEYSVAIAKYVNKVIGIEPYKLAYLESLKNKPPNVIFVNNLIENYQTKTKFDLVLSLATIEHMPFAKKMF